MKVFLLIEHWCDLNPALGVTSGNFNIIGSLEDLVNLRTFYYDEYLVNVGNPIDDHFIACCDHDKPDVVIVNYYPFPNDPRNIKRETLQAIKDRNIPIVFIWFDFVHKQIRDLAVSLLEYAKVSVVIDTVQDDPRFLYTTVPQDHKIFNNPEWIRDIEVSFVGTQYHERRQFLDKISSHFDVFRSGGQREHNLSIQDYASIFKRSKISLNFSAKGDLHQAKSRIYEVMACGALLFEHDTPPIRKWFKPMVHYVPFTDERDLLEKLSYYLRNEGHRKSIAEQGQKEFEQKYNNKNWWNKVFSSI